MVATTGYFYKILNSWHDADIVVQRKSQGLTTNVTNPMCIVVKLPFYPTEAILEMALLGNIYHKVYLTKVRRVQIHFTGLTPSI